MPRSEPANEPVTVAEPPGLGNENPPLPAGVDAMLYPENVTVLGVAPELQPMVRATDRRVSTPLHALVGLVSVTFVDPEPMVETSEPVVVHPVALRVMVADSGLVPVAVRGGEKASPPVM